MGTNTRHKDISRALMYIEVNPLDRDANLPTNEGTDCLLEG